MSHMNAPPTRDQLLRQLARANHMAVYSVALQAALVVVISCLIDWPTVFDHPILPLIGIGVMVGSPILDLFRKWGENKREIGQLKEQTRFGPYDKHQLRSLMNNTLQRLNLPADAIPVYITPDKTLNAGAMRLGLAGFLKSLNGVYLNRQVLHRLTPQEVQDLIGHELGHYYRYYLLADRFRFITFALGALLGIFVAQLTGFHDVLGIFALVSVSVGFWWFASLPWNRHGQCIEFLCDGMGSEVHGVVPSINGLLKIGAEAETHYAVTAAILADPSYRTLRLAELVETIEKAVPYGHATRTQLQAIVETELKKNIKGQNLSLLGFLRHAWGADDEAEDELIEKTAAMARTLQSIPRLDWEAVLIDRNEIQLNLKQCELLVKLIESRPNQALFRLPEVGGSVDGIHPPMRDRILFLWHSQSRVASY